MPDGPGFVIVNVPPATSSGVSVSARARPARSAISSASCDETLAVGGADHRHDQDLGGRGRRRSRGARRGARCSSPSPTDAFTCGNAAMASTTARATNGRDVELARLAGLGRPARGRPPSAMNACGATCWERSRCSPVCRWIRLSGTTSSSGTRRKQRQDVVAGDAPVRSRSRSMVTVSSWCSVSQPSHRRRAEPGPPAGMSRRIRRRTCDHVRHGSHGSSRGSQSFHRNARLYRPYREVGYHVRRREW